MLARAGARLTLADLDPRRAHRLADRLNTRWVPADSIYDVACDIFMPCALGGVLNADTIPRLQSGLIVGAANNQLASDEDAQRLREHDILYTPDYLNNAGGLIALAMGHRQEERSAIRQKVIGIGRTLSLLLDEADHRDLSPAQMADRQAEQRLHDDIGKHAWKAA
jgi:leucine dehydrogenase